MPARACAALRASAHGRARDVHLPAAGIFSGRAGAPRPAGRLIRRSIPMRRSDREITDFQELITVMRGCDVCRLALHDEPYPYILPLNFGLEVDGETVRLYFHGANTGTKYDLIAKNPNVAFEMDRGHELILDDEHGNCTIRTRASSVRAASRSCRTRTKSARCACSCAVSCAGLSVFEGRHSRDDRPVPDRRAHDRQAGHRAGSGRPPAG